MPDRPSRPKDANKLAKLIVDIATGEVDESESNEDTGKNPAAVALGKLGGQKGGEARARTLTPERRAEIARSAAQKRWSSSRND